MIFVIGWIVVGTQRMRINRAEDVVVYRITDKPSVLSGYR